MRNKNMIKKQITFGIIIIFIGIAFAPNIIQSSAIEQKTNYNIDIVTFTQKFSYPTIDQDIDYVKINVKETNSFMINQGGPKLPVFSKTFEFPWGTKIKDIKFSKSEEKTMSLKDKIEPVPFFKESKSNYITQQQIITPEIYENNKYYPSEWFTYQKGAGINKNGEHVLFLTINVYPNRYLSKEDKIKYILNFRIKISYENQKMINFKEDLFDLVVIAPTEFSGTLQPLIDHKYSYNVKSTLMTLEDIYDSYSGRDQAEKIKYFIKYALEEWGIKYVLFVGDINILPIRTTYSMMFQGHGDNILSDLYFSDIYNDEYIFCSWDENENNRFGEVVYDWNNWPPEIIDIDGVDLHSDVHIGRLPCTNEQEVALMVNKIITYEKNTAKQNWFKKIILAGGDTFPPRKPADFDIFEGEITNEKVAEELPDFEHIKLWATKRNLHFITFNWEINRGAGFLSYAGHGYEVGWATYKPNTITNKKIVYVTPYLHFLRNRDKMPIVFFDACLTSKLDFTLAELEDYYPKVVKIINLLTGNSIKPDDHIPTFSWEIMNLEKGGAIATIGATRTAYTYVNNDGVFGGAGYLDVAFFRAYEVGITVGEMLTMAQNDYINFVGKDYFTIEEFALFGDPSLRVGGYP
jgi:hypothetical protein